MSRVVVRSLDLLDEIGGKEKRLSIGFFFRDEDPMFDWDEDNPSCTQSITFNPELTLRASVVKDCNEDGRLPVGAEFNYIWSQKLSALGSETSWNLMENKATKGFILERRSA
ncbi:hypothetical protein FRC07_002124 [Ceratobasidium sp. 392]|nr:hypothetical protein FRC07_002124 [Ceratobasidium sp. 392]